ncbi:MAG: DUF1835 domain-containing protein [Cyclobacteriaceae bacterium]
MKVFHILNGDALKGQFPANSITGEIIVARECLVDGDVSGETLQELIESRVASMHEMYGTSREGYLQKVVPEFNKINDIKLGEVNLWFEDDLFCQVNFWFACSLLKEKSISAFLVRPSASLRYGFGGLSPEDLKKAFENRKLLTTEQISQFAKLWRAYQDKDIIRLSSISKLLVDEFEFLKEAIQAQIDRMADGDSLPERTLRELMTEYGDQDFGLVFREFSNRLPVYGFGDLQVKRLWDQLLQN